MSAAAWAEKEDTARKKLAVCVRATVRALLMLLESGEGRPGEIDSGRRKEGTDVRTNERGTHPAGAGGDQLGRWSNNRLGC